RSADGREGDSGRLAVMAPGDRARIVVLGVLGVFAYHALFFWALQFTPASLSALIVPTTLPLATALTARAVLGERLGPYTLAGAGAAAGGRGVLRRVLSAGLCAGGPLRRLAGPDVHHRGGGGPALGRGGPRVGRAAARAGRRVGGHRVYGRGLQRPGAGVELPRRRPAGPRAGRRVSVPGAAVCRYRLGAAPGRVLVRAGARGRRLHRPRRAAGPAAARTENSPLPWEENRNGQRIRLPGNQHQRTCVRMGWGAREQKGCR